MSCHHEWCLCLVDQGQEFCSDHCREHASEGDRGKHACECGHPACTPIG